MLKRQAIRAYEAITEWERRQLCVWKSEEARAKADKIPLLYAQTISGTVEPERLKNFTELAVRNLHPRAWHRADLTQGDILELVDGPPVGPVCLVREQHVPGAGRVLRQSGLSKG